MPAYYKYFSRIEANFAQCIDIANENYFDALKIQKKIIDDNYEIDGEYLLFRLSKRIMVTIVFSSMALESYLNNYIAGCLGDENYYNVFEKLSWTEKLRLIVQFIFHQEFKKDHVCFTLIRKLERLRNDLIHNKPKYHRHVSSVSLEEIEAFENSQEYIDELFSYDKTEVNNLIQAGFDSLRAVKELAKLIDENDSDAQATVLLFWPQLVGNENEEAKKAIYPELGIRLRTLNMD